MRQPQGSKRPTQDSAEILPFAEGTSGANLQMQMLIETLAETNTHLRMIANVGNDTLSFVRKWVPWMIAAAGVAWPTIGKIVASLPAMPY